MFALFEAWVANFLVKQIYLIHFSICSATAAAAAAVPPLVPLLLLLSSFEWKKHTNTKCHQIVCEWLNVL